MEYISKLFRNHFNNFFGIHYIDFNFDLQESDVILQQKPHPDYPNTIYTQGYPSHMRTYNRKIRLDAKGCIPKGCTQNIVFQRRIEFHLAHTNQQCNYLHIDNLQGNYENIFNRYCPLLARKWYDYRKDIVKIPMLRELPYAYHLQQIDQTAFQRRIPHYNLKVTPQRPKTTKRVQISDVDLNWLGEFLLEE
jgi:hypothetical protein